MSDTPAPIRDDLSSTVELTSRTTPLTKPIVSSKATDFLNR